MKVGDKVVVTHVYNTEDYFYKVGDTATLAFQDEDGHWWAEFDNRQWSEHDKLFCIQEGLARCKVMEN